MSINTVNVTVVMPIKLAQKLEQLKPQNTNRSSFIRELITEGLKHVKQDT